MTTLNKGSKFSEDIKNSQPNRRNYDLDSEENRKLIKKTLFKLDFLVLPPLALLWLANFIDRSNVGNARIAGLSTDLHLKGDEFNVALAVFYATYIVSELPSNLMLKKVGANNWLPTIVIAWGIVTTLFGLVQSYAGLIIVRLALGFCEGGLLPGMVFYLSTLYPRGSLQIRIGIFYASASLSGAFGGLLAFAIIKMKGVAGLNGWRWIFILEGIATVLAGAMSWFILPKELKSVRGLGEKEKEIMIKWYHRENETHTYVVGPNSLPSRSLTISGIGNGIIANSSSEKPAAEHIESASITSTPSRREIEDFGSLPEPFLKEEVRRGILDVQTWLTGVAYLGMCMSLYSYSLFLPSIIASLGWSGGKAQLLTVPPYCPAVVLTVLIAFLADRLKFRGPWILMLLPVSIAGYILAIAATSNGARYGAMFLMAAGVYPSIPCVLALISNNHSGQYKRAASTAFQLMIANCAGFGATFAYTSDQASTHYHKGHSIVLSCLVVSWILIAVNILYCMNQNKKKEAMMERRDEMFEEWSTGRKIGEVWGDRDPGMRYIL